LEEKTEAQIGVSVTFITVPLLNGSPQWSDLYSYYISHFTWLLYSDAIIILLSLNLTALLALFDILIFNYERVLQERKGLRKFQNFEIMLKNDAANNNDVAPEYIWVGDTGEKDEEAGFLYLLVFLTE